MPDTDTPSLRDTLEAAFDAADTGETPAVEAPESAPEAPASADSAPAEAPEAPASETPAEAAQRARDEAGRFTKAEKAAQAAKAAAKPVQPTAAKGQPVPPKQTATPAPGQPVEKPSATPPPAMKAPQSWTPAAREKFAAAPPEVQAEVLKREKETSVLLQETAEARKTHAALRETVQPYAAMLGGAEPMQVVKSFFHTAHSLAYGPQAQKAAVVAHLIKSYGVDINTLAAAIDGQPSPQEQPQAVDPSTIAQQVRQQVMQDFQRQQQAQSLQREQQNVEAFAQSHEFFSDVREAMADLVEVAARRGLQLSMEDAYTRACQLDSGISSVLKQREAAKQANAAQASTQRARAASSSIRSQPTRPPPADPSGDLRGTLERVWAEKSGQ